MDLFFLLMQVTALIGYQSPLVVQKSVGRFPTGAIQSKGYRSRINGGAIAFRPGRSRFFAFRHPGPHSLGFALIQPDGNFVGN